MSTAPTITLRNFNENVIYEAVADSNDSSYLVLITMSLPEEQPLFKKPSSPYWKDATGFGSFVCHTKSKKMMEMATNSLMTNFSLTRGSHQARWLQKFI
jgi:hypothetical protein